MYKEYFSNNPLRHHSANFRRTTSPFLTERPLLSSLAFGLGETEQIPFQHPVQISGSHLFKSQAAGAGKLTFSTCADSLSWIPNFIPAEGRLHPRPWSKERNDGIFHFPSTDLQCPPSLSMLLLASSVTIRNTRFCFSGFKMCKWCSVYPSAICSGPVLSLSLTDVDDRSSSLTALPYSVTGTDTSAYIGCSNSAQHTLLYLVPVAEPKDMVRHITDITDTASMLSRVVTTLPPTVWVSVGSHPWCHCPFQFWDLMHISYWDTQSS